MVNPLQPEAQHSLQVLVFVQFRDLYTAALPDYVQQKSLKIDAFRFVWKQNAMKEALKAISIGKSVLKQVQEETKTSN